MEHTENSKKLRVYFDTNAVNFFFGEFEGRSKHPFKRYDILFSWPLLDEIKCCSSSFREMGLAEFMWQVSNRKILLGIEELMLLEIQSLLKGETISFSSYIDTKSEYLEAWKEARKGTTPNDVRIELRLAIRNEKERILSRFRKGRKRWLPKFRSNMPLPKNWTSAYASLLKEKEFNEVIYFMMKTFGFLDQFDDPEAIFDIDHEKLCCTSIGLEFYIALWFLIDSQPKKQGSPDLGDIYDMKHAFYVGLSDYFVTGDQRVYHILHDLIDTKSAKIIWLEEFHKQLRGA